MNILEDLWYGQICPCADEDYRNKEYRKLVALFERNKEKMCSTLSQEQQENLEKMENLWDDMEQITQRAAFITGFRLAVQIMASSV